MTSVDIMTSLCINDKFFDENDLRCPRFNMGHKYMPHFNFVPILRHHGYLGLSLTRVKSKIVHLYFKFTQIREKTGLGGSANSKGADQPVHLRSQISAFVNLLLERIISKLPRIKISLF